MHEVENSSTTERFTERTPWPIWLWLFLLFLAGSLSLAFWAALGLAWALGTAAVQFIGLAYAAWRTPLQIELSNQVLRVGVATLPIEFITSVRELNSNEMQKLRGPAVDPYAYASIRFWIPTGVQVVLSDPQDRTPYWLVSSKKAHQLTDALSRQLKK